jgi:hypothetical protein
MARTAVAITPLAVNTFKAAVSSAIVVADGARIDAKGDLQGLILHITQTHGATKVITIPKGVGAQAITAGQGNLTYTIAATTGEAFVNLEGARVCQADGSVHVDFAADHAGTIAAYRIPRGG